MKKYFLAGLILLPVFSLFAQNDLSGSYGYSMPAAGSVQKDKSAVPGGQLVLLKMEGNQYRFWLDVLTGAPGYNRGETDGTVSFVNDTASFDNTFEDAIDPCVLKFRRSGKNIIISNKAASFNCGFGNGVSADGEYKWLDNQVVLNNAWLKKQYPHSGTLKVGAVKAEMYRDQDGMQSFPAKRYLSKGDEFISIAETEKTVYTERITPDGTLQYGWLRKSDIKE